MPLDQRDFRPGLDRGIGGGKPRGTGAEHDQIVAPRGSRVPPAGGTGARQQFAPAGVDGLALSWNVRHYSATLLSAPPPSHPPAKPARRNPAAMIGLSRIRFQIMPVR